VRFPANDQLLIAALNGVEYQKADCRLCVSVTGPMGTVVVRIVDLCPGCGAGDLDLSMTAFSRIAPLSAGRVPITWHYVVCP
jgi:expansin (peptidoglycan-binding protein)